MLDFYVDCDHAVYTLRLTRCKLLPDRDEYRILEFGCFDDGEYNGLRHRDFMLLFNGAPATFVVGTALLEFADRHGKRLMIWNPEQGHWIHVLA